MTNLPVLCLGGFLIGGFEWFLAIKRTKAVYSHKPFTVAWTVYLETFLAYATALFAIKELSTVEALVLYSVYCLGGALGSIVPMIKKDVSD